MHEAGKFHKFVFDRIVETPWADFFRCAVVFCFVVEKRTLLCGNNFNGWEYVEWLIAEVFNHADGCFGSLNLFFNDYLVIGFKRLHEYTRKFCASCRDNTM